MNIYSKNIKPNDKIIEVYNPNLSTDLMKEKGYIVRTNKRKDRTPSIKEVNELLKKIEILKYTKGFDSISKQILLHRILNYNITQLKFYYPQINEKEFVKAKRLFQ